MAIDILYNLLFFIVFFGAMSFIGFYFRKVSKSFKKDFLGDLILMFFVIIGSFGISSVCKRFSTKINHEVYEKLGLPEYKVIIYPKSYPFENTVKVKFINKDIKKEITIILDAKNYNSEDIYQKIKVDKDLIDSLLKD